MSVKIVSGGRGRVPPILEKKRINAEEGLKESERRYRTLFEYAGTAVAVIENDTTISMVNKKFEELSGYSGEEVEGKMSWTVMVSEKDRERMLGYHRQRRIDQSKVPTHYEFTFVGKNGEERQVDISVSIIPGTDKSIASMRDITEERKAQEEIKCKVNELTTLFRVSKMISSTLELETLFRRILDAVLPLVNAQVGAILLVDEKELTRCWEVKECDNKECPAFHSNKLYCWTMARTYCYEKITKCARCPVFRNVKLHLAAARGLDEKASPTTSPEM